MNILTFVLQAFLVPIWVLTIGFKLYFWAKLLYKWNYALSGIPGPKLAAWTRLWWLKSISRSEHNEQMKQLHCEYGPIVRISPKSIIVSDPETTRKVLAVGSHFKRGPWFDSLRLDAFTSNVVSERDPVKHQQLRAVLAPGLSGKDICDVESTVDKYMTQYIQLIERRINATQNQSAELDLSETIPLLTLDIVAHLCIGENFGCIESQSDKYDLFEALNFGMLLQPYMAVLTEATATLLCLGKLPWVRTWLFPKHTSSNGIGRVMQKVHQTIESRRVYPQKRISKTDLLDSVLSRGLHDEQAISEILIVITSGVGATSYAIQAIIRSIVDNMKVMRRLQDEIDEFVAGNTNGPFDQLPDAILKRMPYLQACILEGLRMYPPVFSQLRERVTPPEGAFISGYYVPGGTYVGFNSVGAQLSHAYGDRPSEFHPERWIIDDEIRLKQMRRDLDLVYGYGNSKCLGVNMANMELNKVIFRLFSKYDISFSDAHKPWKTRGDFIIKDFRINLRHRENKDMVNGVFHNE